MYSLSGNVSQSRDFWQVSWTNGATEKGSSGSLLFNGNQRVKRVIGKKMLL